MKVGILSQPNEKGQVVIPKAIRDALAIDEDVSLNITLRGRGIYMYPIKEVVGQIDEESSYFETITYLITEVYLNSGGLDNELLIIQRNTFNGTVKHCNCGYFLQQLTIKMFWQAK